MDAGASTARGASTVRGVVAAVIATAALVVAANAGPARAEDAGAVPSAAQHTGHLRHGPDAQPSVMRYAFTRH
ncbi:hypothetical protein [Streptomyces sp. NPDC040750]|uniref:hypothetical protein n=1 Tax=Streptomyces sp. NPDC040750 TaxID=3154491 RepID=UPI0033E7989F